MNNNLPAEIKKENIFKRLFNFVKKIFKKDTNIQIIEQNNNVESVYAEDKKSTNKITELYKVSGLDEVNEEYRKREDNRKRIEEIIQIIEKEPKTIKKLDIPQLEVIDNYYKEKIAECKMKIAKLS